MARVLAGRLSGLAGEWLEVAPRVLLYTFLVELVFNRILFRVIVFMPPSGFRDAFGSLVTIVGVAAMNLLTLASAATLAALVASGARLRYVPAIVLAYALLDWVGVAELYWTLPLLAAYILALDPRRAGEAAALAAMAAASWRAGAALAWLANILWILAPLGLLVARGVDRRGLRRGAPWAALALLFTLGNQYIAGQVFVFALSLLSPWLLAPAILLYTATGSTAAAGLLLNGPGVQLSSQVLALAALYGAELSGGRRG